MSNCNIKIPDTLYERLKTLARKKGYSSAEEMAIHILEKTAEGASHEISVDVSGVATSAAEEAKTETVKRQLKGLGYFNG